MSTSHIAPSDLFWGRVAKRNPMNRRRSFIRLKVEVKSDVLAHEAFSLPSPSGGLISEKLVKSSSWSGKLCTHSSRSMINHLTFYPLKRALVWLNFCGKEEQNFSSFMELFNRTYIMRKVWLQKPFQWHKFKSLKELISNRNQSISIRPLGASEWAIGASKFDIDFESWNLKLFDPA